MAVTNPVKIADRSRISCDGVFTVTLGLTAVPDIAAESADIVLILDRSGSMGSSGKLESMKKGVKQQIDIISEATGGIAGKTIGTGSRIGMVSFSTEAVIDQPLTTDAALLKQTVDPMKADGITNHAAAFTKALSLFSPQSANQKVLVMFTDGGISDGENPDPIVQAAKDAGVIIYCIGVEYTRPVLEKWASEPTETHVAWSQNPDQLENLFVEIGKEIVHAGASDGKIEEVLNPDFRIVSMGTPSAGTVQQTSANSLIWSFDALGTVKEEAASLSFDVQHVSREQGRKLLNQSIHYSDKNGNTLEFPNPTIEVECAVMPIVLESCPAPVSFQVNGCQDAAAVNLGEVKLSGLGRIIQMDATLKNICPNKRVAVAVQLTEVGANGAEFPRGLKMFTVPAHTGEACTDVELKCIRFVVPEDLDETGAPDSLCNARSFRARVMANYIDTDFVCCGE